MPGLAGKGSGRLFARACVYAGMAIPQAQALSEGGKFVLKEITPIEFAVQQLAAIRRDLEATQRLLGGLIKADEPNRNPARLTDPRTGKPAGRKRNTTRKRRCTR